MNKIVLLVEDNPSDEKLTLRALRNASVPNEVTVAHDGVEALEFLFGTGAHAGRDISEQPALVLLDLKLPRMDGLEVIRRIRGDERTRLLPIVVLTSSALEEDIAGSYSAGANAYMRKPVDFGEFVDAARVLGTFWLRHNETPPPPGKR
ncbi:MAG TPA: response regulator [Nannocystaceae bacterium]|nr:response regulator [Nannocystaceae bacterium]